MRQKPNGGCCNYDEEIFHTLVIWLSEKHYWAMTDVNITFVFRVVKTERGWFGNLFIDTFEMFMETIS